MIGDMDCLTILCLGSDVIGSLGALIMQALLERLLALFCAGVMLSGLASVAAGVIARAGASRVARALHARPAPAPR